MTPSPSEVSVFLAVDFFKQTWRQFLSVWITKVIPRTFPLSAKQTRFYAGIWSHPAVVVKCPVPYVTAVSELLLYTFLWYWVSLMTFVQERRCDNSTVQSRYCTKTLQTLITPIALHHFTSASTERGSRHCSLGARNGGGSAHNFGAFARPAVATTLPTNDKSNPSYDSSALRSWHLSIPASAVTRAYLTTLPASWRWLASCHVIMSLATAHVQTPAFAPAFLFSTVLIKKYPVY